MQNKGLFHYNVMPFGLSNAPATFSHIIEKVLRPVLSRCAYPYQDDICTYSKTFRQHLSDLEEVFTLLQNANLKINWEKSTFGQPYIEYRGTDEVWTKCRSLEFGRSVLEASWTHYTKVFLLSITHVKTMPFSPVPLATVGKKSSFYPIMKRTRRAQQ